MITVKQLNRFCLLTTAPFVGLMLWMLASTMTISLPQPTYPEPVHDSEIKLANELNGLLGNLDTAKQRATVTAKSIKKSIALYRSTNESMIQIVKIASTQAGRPAKIYDRRITSKIGTPYSQVQSDNITAQLFKITAQNFKGYALKVKLKTDKSMKMVLGKDKVGEAETTLAAVKRYKAVAGVNAGGFADNRGQRYPLSTTMLNGKYVSQFEASYKDLFFVGMNKNMKLIGGKYSSQSQLDKQEPLFGASFVPVLMKNGVPQAIPQKWQVSPKRAPRTVVANYKDNQLLFIVTDGYNENGSSGATLQEMQILLTRFGAIDGYNLDGGGSSSLIFNGRIVNKPSDGRLRPLPTHFLFFK